MNRMNRKSVGGAPQDLVHCHNLFFFYPKLLEQSNKMRFCCLFAGPPFIRSFPSLLISRLYCPVGLRLQSMDSARMKQLHAPKFHIKKKNKKQKQNRKTSPKCTHRKEEEETRTTGNHNQQPQKNQKVLAVLCEFER